MSECYIEEHEMWVLLKQLIPFIGADHTMQLQPSKITKAGSHKEFRRLYLQSRI
jgi:hypothetical protein